jgi:hypothetical protein
VRPVLCRESCVRCGREAGSIPLVVAG